VNCPHHKIIKTKNFSKSRVRFASFKNQHENSKTSLQKRRYKKAKKKRRRMKKVEGIMEEHPPLIPPIKGGRLPLHLSPLKGEIKWG